MTVHLLFSRGAACLRMLLTAALLLFAASNNAQAQYTVTKVVINGGTTTVNVAPGGSVTVDVTVDNRGGLWRTTSFTYSPGGASICATSEQGTFIGIRTVRYVIPVPSTSNLFSLAVSVHSHSACKTPPGHTSSAAFNFPNAVNTRPVVVGVDHLQIEHDGIGRTCGAKTVTVKACANLACTALYTPATTITLTANNSGSWAPVTQTFSGGTATALLTKIDAGTVTVGGTITSPAPKTATTCLKSGVLGNCDIVFSATSCRLDAVETSKLAGTPIFTKTTNGFSLDVVNLNASGVPANTTATIYARLVDEASCVGTNPPLTFLSPEVAGSFVNTSRLNFTFAPSVASKSARVRIINGPLIGCSTDKFAIRPASFTVTAVGANASATGTNAAATPILKAGTTAFTLTATSSAGYSAQPAVSNARLDAADVNGAGTGLAGTLTGAFVAGAGAASGSFTYSEVGYVKLLPFTVYDNGDFALVDAAANECRVDDGSLPGGTAMADANLVDGSGKIACYFGNTETAYFGRFVPDRFVLGAATLKERAALTSCTTPQFSYMGEQMQASVALTAVNGAGGQTANYTGIFNRLPTPVTQLGINAMDDAPAPGVRTAFPACAPTKAHPCIEAGTASGAFADGEAAFVAPLTVFRPTAAVGPFDNLKIGVAPIDLDDVRLDPATYNIDTVTVPTASATNNHVLLASTKARYGRLNIDNAYGSELLNLTMRVSAQYWSGSGYVTNKLDSCTPLPAANFTLSGHRRGITTVNMDASHVIGGANLVGGVGKVVLTKPAPVPVQTGYAVLNFNNLILTGSARATFGVYKAGPVIYVRETY